MASFKPTSSAESHDTASGDWSCNEETRLLGLPTMESKMNYSSSRDAPGSRDAPTSITHHPKRQSEKAGRGCGLLNGLKLVVRNLVMPRATRATTRSAPQRAAPYPTRSVSTAAQPAAMAVAVSTPGLNMGWDQMHQQQQYYLNAQQQEQMQHYRQGVYQAEYGPMPTPVSGALPVQSVRTPIVQVPSHIPSAQSGNTPWTNDMDDILIEHHGRLKWEQIAEKLNLMFVGNKTGNACRKRYARLVLERKDPSKWDPEKVARVVNAYNREGMRERIWSPLAEAVGEDWQNVERLAYSQGLRLMTGNRQAGHRRRASHAVTHRSHPSINSDSGHNLSYDEDEPTDDSGIVGDVQNDQYAMQMPQQGYAQRESYHQALPDYGGPEDYYRDYHRA